MEKSYFNLDQFKANVFQKGLADADRFEVFFPTPPLCIYGKKAEFDQTFLAGLYAEQVYFPPLNIITKQLRISGPAFQRPVGIDFGGDSLSISFVLDRDMEIKKMFDYWMQSIVSPDQFFVEYRKNYVCPIEIRQLNRDDEIVYSVLIEDAYPKSMVPIDLHSTNQGQYHRLNISFAYRKWKQLQLPSFGDNAIQTERDLKVTGNVGIIGGTKRPIASTKNEIVDATHTVEEITHDLPIGLY